MEKRALLAVILSLVVIVLYQEVFLRSAAKKPPIPTKTDAAEPAERSDTATEAQEPVEEIKPADRIPPTQSTESRSLTVETPLYVATLSSYGGVLTNFKLVHYKDHLGDEASMFDVIANRKESGPKLYIPMGRSDFDDSGVNYGVENLQTKAEVAENQEKAVTFVRRYEGRLIKKTFVFHGDNYVVGLRATVEDGFAETSAPVWFFWKAQSLHQGKNIEQLSTSLDGKIRHESVDHFTKPTSLKGGLEWFALTDKHFLSALAFPEQKAEELQVKTEGPWLDIGVAVPSKVVAGKATVQATLFLGPKEVERLQKLSVGLEKAVDFGWFWFVAMPLLQCLRLFHRFTHNYGLDIILLTVLIKVAFVPLTQKSLTSMREMQKLQPQMAKIREKFKDDRERLNKEMMELYKRHRVNPLGGCLPMVLQFPVFIGLYQALLNAVELRHAPFAFWINDLSAPDRLVIGGVGIPVLTILMGGSMLLQQWMTPSAGDPTQKIMMLILPVVFTFMFINFPSGLVLYWLVNNLLSVGQQYYVTKAKS